MTKKKKILFVCLGNICRSPLAEAIFQHKIRENGWEDQYEADSCGTAGYHVGDPPDRRSVANASRNGVQIQHVGRQIDPTDLDRFDYILTMDKSNLANVMRLADAQKYAHKISLVRDYDPEPGDEVPDPYYGGERGFQDVFEMLDRTISHFLAKVNAVGTVTQDEA